MLLRQERMTLDGKTFQIYKFRTMVDEAEKDTGPVCASADDPRRTTVGVWLRRFNLDELPQLLNVLLGRHEPGRTAPRAAAVRAAVPASGSRSTCCATA